MKKLINITLLSLILISPSVFAKDIDLSVKGEIKSKSLKSQIALINLAKPDDVIIIHIETPGGNTYTALNMCKAMINSKAKTIIAVVDKEASSAGADIAGCADTIKLAPKATLLYHLGSSRNPYTGETIIYRDDMDISKLPAVQQEYVLKREILEYTFVTGLGISGKIARISWKGEEGLVFDGENFAKVNPKGVANRKNVLLQREVENMLKFLETGV